MTDKPAKVQIDVLQSDINFLKVCLVVISKEADMVRSTVPEQAHAVHAVVDLPAFCLKRVVGQLVEVRGVVLVQQRGPKPKLRFGDKAVARVVALEDLVRQCFIDALLAMRRKLRIVPRGVVEFGSASGQSQ